MESHRRFATFNFVFLAALALLPSFVTAATLTQHLEAGSQGSEVTSLQQLLIGQGFLSGSATGYFGPLTTAAVAKFQSAHGFSPTGTVGPQTRDALNGNATATTGNSNQDLINALLAEIKVLQAQIAQIIAARNGQTTTLTRPLALGASGSDVTALQTFLQSSGYLTVPPTGYFGPATQAAVAAYQSSKNLEPVGAVGPKTLALINTAMTPPPQNNGNGNGNGGIPPTAGGSGGGGGGSVNSTPSSGGTSNGGGGGGGGSAPPPPPPPPPPAPNYGNGIFSAYFQNNTFTIPSGESPAAASQVNVGSDTTVSVGTVNGNDTIKLKGNSAVKKNAAGSLDVSTLAAADVDPASLTLPANLAGEAALQFGINGVELLFTQPATISLNVGSANDGDTLNIYRSELAAGPWLQTGIVTPTCVVSAGLCTFDTTLASKFTATRNKPTVTIAANPTSVASGGSTIVTWSSTNATSCTASGAWTGSKTTAGTQTFTNLTANTTYTLTCSGKGRASSATQSASITVTGAPADTTAPSAPTSLAGSATSQTQINLTWSASTDNVGVVGYRVFRNGTQVGTPTGTSYSDSGLTASTAYSYTVKAIDAAGNLSANSNTASITTQSPPLPTVTLSTSATSVTSGNGATLTWSSTNATSCTASGAWSGTKAVSGTQVLTNLTTTGTYTLTCTGSGGSANQSVTITVTAALDTTPPTVTITGPVSSLPAGTTQATLTATTNESALCGYSNVSTAAYGSMTAFTTTGTLAHSTVLSGLTNGTSYTYYVKCQDAALNSSNNATVTFAVAAVVSPPTPTPTPTPTPPPTGLPSGVTLQQIDGGPNYYCNNGFTYACSGGWDSPNYFPVMVFLVPPVTDQAAANRWKDLNVTGFLAMDHLTANAGTILPLLRSNNLSLVPNWPDGFPSGAGTEIPGILTYDEPQTWTDAAKTPLSSAPNAQQDGRFWAVNNTINFLLWGAGNISGIPAPSDQAALFYSTVATPNGTQRHINVQSQDTYWMGATKTPGRGYELTSGGNIYGLGRDMTQAEAARASHYGDMVDVMRSFQTGHFPAPVMNYVENGGPFPEDTSAAYYISPAEFNAAVWSNILHGARGVLIFNHSFGGPGVSNDNFGSSYYQTVQSGQTISIYNQAKTTFGLIKQLAPVLNSPFAVGYATVSPGFALPWTASDMNTSIAPSFEVMAKYYTGPTSGVLVQNSFYLFAAYRGASSDTNKTATFTIKNTGATQVQELTASIVGGSVVVSNSRTIPITSGTTFTDTFANGNTVHIYLVGNGSVVPPPPPPVTPPPPVSTMFTIGQQVTPNATVNVRATAAGTLLGTQAAGAVANVIGGPTSAVLNGVTYIWWNLNFVSGVDGWVGEDNLAAYSVTPPPPPTSTPTPTPTPTPPPPPPPVSGIAQYPTLLNGYVVRPSWQVAGVDYAVGMPAGTVLKNPTSISMSGVSVNSSTHTVTITANNTVLDGYDFSLNGGWEVYVQGASGVDIKDSNFVVGSNALTPIIEDGNSTNLTVEHNTIDGNGPNNLDTLLNSQTTNQNAVAFTSQYNWFKNSPSDDQWVLNGQAIVQYNLYTSGVSKHASGSHVDFVQFARSFSTGSKINYNTLVFQLGGADVAGEGIQIEAQLGSTLTNTEVGNNTFVAYPATNASGVSASYFLVSRQDSGSNLINGISIHDNYMDATGAYGFFYAGVVDGTNAVVTHNIDMTDGKLVNVNNTESTVTPPPPPPPPPVTPPPPPPVGDTTAPVITITAPAGALAAGTTQTTLSATTNENATCAWSATAGSAFASMTTFTTTSGTSHSTMLTGLTNGSSYTRYVKCKDTAGNISADSSQSFSVASAVTSPPPPPPPVTPPPPPPVSGGACPRGTSFSDGCSAAPAGAAQLPSLLSSYTARPAWNVPGVDYPVGITSGTVLKNPSTISMTGVTVNATAHTVSISGSNITLDGYDFSLNGGWGVQVNSGNNITIQNNNFKVGTNLNTPIGINDGVTNVTVQKNVIDGSSLNSGQGLIDCNATTATIQYNWIKNSFNELQVTSSNVASGFNMTIRYNVYENAGLGFNSGAHGDWIQQYNGTGRVIDSMNINYNVWLQDAPIAQGRTQGLSLASANIQQGPVKGYSASNNVMIGTQGAYVNFAVISDNGNINGVANVNQNYFDMSGIGSANGGGGDWLSFGDYNGSSAGHGPYNGTISANGNMNMVSGQAMPSPNVASGGNPPPPPPVTPPSPTPTPTPTPPPPTPTPTPTPPPASGSVSYISDADKIDPGATNKDTYTSFAVSGTKPVVMVTTALNSASGNVSSIVLSAGLTSGTPYLCKQQRNGTTDIEIWAIPAPSGSGTITVNYSVTADHQSNAALFQGANQATPCVTSDSVATTGSGASLSVTPTNVTANDMVVYGGGQTVTGDAPHANTGTEIFFGNLTGANFAVGYRAGSGAVTVGWGATASNEAVVGTRVQP